MVFNSQVLVLADTSLSMAARDVSESSEGPSRTEEVARALSDARLTDALRRRHDVVVWKFGETAEPLVKRASTTRRAYLRSSTGSLNFKEA